MFMVKIGSESFWNDYDKQGGEYPLRIGDRIYWAGTVEPSRGTLVRRIDFGVTISYDRYKKHGPRELPVLESTLRDPNEFFFLIVGQEDHTSKHTILKVSKDE